GKEIPDPATGNKGTNFAHYKGIDDLLHAGRVERDVKKRAAIYAEAQKRMERDLVCLPISDAPGQWARDPKRGSTPVGAGYGGRRRLRGVLAALQLQLPGAAQSLELS